MKCRGAVLRGVGQDWAIEEITLDPPRAGEVVVKMAVAGVCHSDDHFTTGDCIPSPDLAAIMAATGGAGPEYFPVLGGHEGAGVVAEVGPGVRSVQPGDRVAMSFIAACGRCRWCVIGHDLSVRHRRHDDGQGDGRPTAPPGVTSATRI